MSTRRTSTFLWTGLLLALGLWVPSATYAGPRKRDPKKTIKRYKAYLSRKPYHAWAFDKLVEAAVSINKLKDLVGSYQQRVKEEPDDRAARVVLARLLAKTNRIDDALDQLKKIPKPDAALHKLRGELFLRRNEPKAALAAFDVAARSTKDKRLLQEIQRRRGEAALMAGKRAEAIKAFRAMAKLKPNNFNTRLDVANVFAQHNLIKEALQEFDQAEKLAGRSAAKRCRVLSEKGRLHERLIQIPKALAVYRRAIGLMARGNWLKRELYARILAIHQRSGKLADLIAQCRKDVQADPQDLSAREFLATSLEASGKRKEARDVLQEAIKKRPSDLKVSRRLIALLTDLKETDAVVAEYQRIIGKHPRELDLYLELGKVFASSGKLEQAKRQWERTLAKRLTDAGLCIRLAELYAFYDQSDEAVRMYRKAIELEPKEVRHTGDLARYLAKKGRTKEIPALLERATKAAGDTASRLEQLSGLWQEHGDAKRALELLDQAIKLKPNDPRLLTGLADLQIKLGDLDAAAGTLKSLINEAKEPAVRRAAVDKMMRLVRKQKAIPSLIRVEGKQVAQRVKKVAPYLLLARAYTYKRIPELAIKTLEAMLKVFPGYEDASEQLARLYQGQGEYAKALASYKALIKKSPQARRKYLKAIAKVHLTLFDHEQALACYLEILRSSPDNAAAFKDVGDAYEKLTMLDKARDCYQQAVRLKPDDGRLRIKLAKLHRRLGDSTKAKREFQITIKTATDEHILEDARGRLYELLGEEGRIEQEVESLRTRIDKNPYDVEAPLSLIDIYVRELEYEQALELLKKLLGYQPKELKLLEQRARILFLMERYDEAIVDFETLWKLPKSDQEALSLKIAECALKAGNLKRAKRALESVKNAREIADLYQSHDLVPEAVAALERGVKQNPTSVRLNRELSRLQEKLEKHDEAIAALERVIGLQGERWKTVIKLGELYRKAGQEQQALAIGTRLFALLRAKTHKPPKKKLRRRLSAMKSVSYNWSYSSSYYSRYRYYNQRMRGFTSVDYTRRLNALQRYFSALSKEEVFAELATKELKLQPQNTALLSTILRHLTKERDKDGQGIALIRWVRKATLHKQKIPAGYTARAWARYLDGQVVSRYRRDNELCKQRVAALRKEVQADKPPEARRWLQLIQLLNSLRKYEEAKRTILSGIEKLPREYRLRLAIAQRLDGEKAYKEASPHYAKAIELLAAEPVDEKEVRKRNENLFRRARPNLLRGFPSWIRKRVRLDHLRRLYRLTSSRHFGSVSWSLGSRTSLHALKMTYVRCLMKQERKAEAKEVLLSLRPKHDDDLVDWGSLAAALHRHEFFAEAKEIGLKLRKLEAGIELHPILGHNRAWANTLQVPIANLAQILDTEGKHVEAYDLYRTYGRASAGELILRTHGKLDAAASGYRAQMEKAQSELAGGGDATRRRYRAAGVKLAEIYQYRKKWDQVITHYEGMIKHLPDDFSLYEMVALLQERAGRYEKAVATHRRIIERKRVLNRAMRRDFKPKGRVLTPLKPRGTRRNEDWIWRTLRGGGWYSRYYASSQRYSVRSNYAAILKTYLDRREIGKAAESMRRLAREDMTTFRWLGWYLGRLIENYRLGAKGVPIMRLLYSYNPSYDYLGIQYGKALVAAKKLEEAKRVLSTIVNRRGGSSWYGRSAQRELDRVEARLKGKKTVTLADIRAAAAKDPRSMKKRLRLAQRLVKERRFTEALSEVRTIRKRAPHMKEGKRLLKQLYRVLGMQDELFAEIKKDLKGANDQKKFEIYMQLTEELFDGAAGDPQALTAEVRGYLEQASKALGRLTASRGRARYSVAIWYLQKGYLKEGKQVLEAELARLEKKKQKADNIKQRLHRLEFAAGNPLPALDHAWDKMKEQTSHSGKTGIVKTLAGVLRMSPYPEAHREVVFKAADKHGGIRGDLYKLAFYLAIHDAERAQQAITAAIARNPKESFYLHTLRINFAQADKDPKQELKLIEEVEALRRAGKLQATGVSDVNAKKAFLRHKARLLLALERKKEAMEIWKEEYDASQTQNKKRLADLYERHGFIDEAMAMLKAYMKKRGRPEYRTMEKLAGLYRRQEKWDEAIALYKKVLILAPGRAGSVHSNLRYTYKAAQKLEVYRKDLEAKLAADPNDQAMRDHIIALARMTKDKQRIVKALLAMTKRVNLRQNAYQRLADHYWQEGDKKTAVTYLEKVLDGNVQSWSRKNLTRRLAEYYLKSNPKKARELLRKGHRDPDEPNALREMARFYKQHKVLGEASKILAELVQQKPKDMNLRYELADLLEQQKKYRPALEHVWRYVQDPKQLGNLSSQRARILRLADKCGEDARIAERIAKLGPAPSGKGAQAEKAREARYDLMFRAATIDLFRRRLSKAAAGYQRILKERPRDLPAQWGLLSAYDRADEYAKTLALLEKLHKRARREPSAFWSARYALRRMRATLRLRKGDLEGARRAWRRPQRSTYTSAWRYAFYNNPYDWMNEYMRQLRAHHQYEEWRKAMERGMLLGASTYGSFTEALWLSGKQEEAIKRAWRSVYDPTGGVVSSYRSSYSYSSYRWRRGRYYSSGRGSAYGLINYYRELGKLDEFWTKLQALEKRFPKNWTVRNLADRYLRSEERWEEVLQRQRKQLAEYEQKKQKTAAERKKKGLKPVKRQKPDIYMLGQIADTLLKLEKYAEALPLLEKILRTRRIEKKTGNTSNYYRYYVSTSSYYYGSYYNRTRATPLSKARRQLMALYAKLGQAEQARQLEAEELKEAKKDERKKGRTHSALAAEYAKLKLKAEARRLYDEALKRDDKQAAPIWDRLLKLYQECGDAVGLKEAVAKRLELYAKAIAKAPYTTYVNLQRARFVVQYGGDMALVEKDAELARRENPRDGNPHVWLGWVQLRRGEAKALQSFETARRLARLAGQTYGPYLQFGYGLALAKTDKGKAAPLLRRALAQYPKHMAAAQAREVLK